MSKPRDSRQKDLLRPAPGQIVDPTHPLVRLAAEIDWGSIDDRFSAVCRAGPGQPPLPTRLVAGLLILKHTHNLSDEALCARWLENPYFQLFCGEESFQHRLPFDRSSLTRWRQRLGEAQLAALIQESLSVAHKTGALASKDLERVAVATPVTQPKGGQFVLHAQALHGNPFDGHTLGPVVEELQALTGVEVRRIHVDRGYQGHSHPRRSRVWISGRVRGATKTIRREMRRRAAIEPVIGHLKAEHRMDRNHLKGRDGDRTNAILAAAGYNFHLLLRWLQALLPALIAALFNTRLSPQSA